MRALKGMPSAWLSGYKSLKHPTEQERIDAHIAMLRSALTAYPERLARFEAKLITGRES